MRVNQFADPWDVSCKGLSLIIHVMYSERHDQTHRGLSLIFSGKLNASAALIEYMCQRVAHYADCCIKTTVIEAFAHLR